MAVVLVLIHCQFYFYKKTFFCSSVVNNWENIIPQFRSIIPCELLLYIEVTFFGIYPLI